MASTKIINLKQNQVDIWRLNLDLDENSLNELQNLLSEEEITRAEKLKSKELRRRFIAARGMLRKILSRYTRKNPQDLKFQYNQNGKPELVDSQIYFNLSHSQDLALCAVALNPVGIDLEKIKDNLNHLKLAQEYFSEKEYNCILNLPQEQQKKAFYQIWTRKEAYVKAKGSSLSKSLSRDLDTPGWFITDLNIDSYATALAIESKKIEIRPLTLSQLSD